MTCKNAFIQEQIQRPNHHQIKKVFALLALLICVLSASGQDRRRIWTDSILRTLTLKEKIGQLFLMKLPSALDADQKTELMEQIKDVGIGGVWIEHGGPVSTARFISQAQSAGKVPLLTGIRAGTGLGESLDSAIRFLPPVALGAIRNDTLLYSMGEAIAAHMKLLGLHINFAPNTSTWKPGTAYDQYFSDQKIRVARKALNLVHGFQDRGILACPLPTMRIPGKSADGTDSVIFYTSVKMDTAELHTIRTLIRSGTGAVMTSQFRFSVTDNKKSVPAFLSPLFLNDYLFNKFGFRGLALCELPEMPKRKRGEKRKKKGELELQALLAGNHMLVNSPNVNSTLRLIQKQSKKNPALIAVIDKAVQKVLETKYDAGLAVRRVYDPDNLFRKLNLPADRLLQHQLVEAAVTVVRNSFSFLPVRQLEDRKFVCLSVGRGDQNEFSRYLGKYTGFEKLSVPDVKDTAGVETKLLPADIIVVGVFPQAGEWHQHMLPMLQRLAATKNIVLCFFGNPAAIRFYPGFPVVMAAYTDEDLVQKISAQIIFGGMKGQGALPFTVAPNLKEGTGIITPVTGRLSYTLPEAAGMDSETLEQIIPIANEAMNMQATPGIEVLVARKGKIIYEKPFGYLTYDKKSPVTDETIFDLASVTKISATLQTVMFMQEKGLIDINKKIAVYLPEFRKSNKKDFTLKDILTHQAGLWPFLPFWAQTVKDTVHLPLYYSRKGTPDFPYPVSANMYAARAMRDSLYHWILHAKVVEKTNRIPYDYRYSDMGFFMLMHLAEKVLNQPMDQFLEQNIYEVLGASTTGFLPLTKFPASRIAPTENDKLFRRSQLVGYVHDQLAAMNGGVAGHAGLFSTANDLAKLGQMWLQKGSYAGHRYFKPETLDLFTKKQFENSRRGLGWDKPTVSDPNGPTSAYASPQTFGHTGFTGISIWVDPEFDLVFIFFSNRVYPEMTNNKILNANIRPRVQDVVYRSIFNYCSNR